MVLIVVPLMQVLAHKLPGYFSVCLDLTNNCTIIHT